MFFKKPVLLLLISFFCLLVGYYIPNSIKESSKSFQLEQFQQVFSDKEVLLIDKLEKLIDDYDSSETQNLTIQYAELSAVEGFSYFIFNKNKLEFWTDEKVSFSFDQLNSNQKILLLGNGWYYKVEKRNGAKKYIGLMLIQTNYAHENKYLKNEFFDGYQEELIQSIKPPSNYGYSIVNSKEEIVFDLELKSTQKQYSSFLIIQSVLFLLGIVMLLLTIPRWFESRRNKFIASILAILSVRFGLLYFTPEVWESLEFYEPNIYAYSSWMSSFGELILNGVTTFLLAYQIKKNTAFINKKWLLFLLFILANFLGSYILILIEESILNSTISFNLNNFFDLNYLSFLCLLLFGLNFYSVLLLVDSFVKRGKHYYSNNVLILSAFVVGLFVSLLVNGTMFWYIGLWILLPFLILLFNIKRTRSTVSILFLLVYLSALSAIVINSASLKRESKKRVVVIQKLAEEKDPIAEYLFDKIQKVIRNDSVLKQLVEQNWEERKIINDYLKETYFTGYWKKYSILFTSCEESDSFYVNSSKSQVSCIDFYQSRIKFEGDLVSSSNFFQLRNFAGRIDYIAQIELPKDTGFFNLFIELSANMFNRNGGYPELLIDEKSHVDNSDIRVYSYAVYDQNNLIMNAGDFNYSTQNKVSEIGENSFYQYQSENHVHTVYKKDKNTTIVLSKRIESYYDFMTSLAYLLVIYSSLYVLLSISLTHFPLRFKVVLKDFSSRIQLFLITSLLFALVLFGVGTTYYIKKQNQEKNFKNISEKIRSVNIELNNKIGGENELSDSINTYVNNMLVKFSNVFYTDINLYDTSGVLYASSRPEIFSKGLKGNLMNPIAFRGLVIENKAEWVQKEQVGKMEYLSAYIPFKNDNNEVIAYLNLPYFARQGELQEEISTFLVSTINIYVAIFAISLLISVLLINQLSKPLLMIRKQISHLKLGGKLELIEWNSQDEIGSLVKEYNKMIVELSESAERLAQSERESAWREMAKQIAHEIKNPLTPMKLSIQYLQLAYERGSEDLEDRINKTTKTLVEQIETLSNIATEFSHFAKMPEKKHEMLDLLGIIITTVDLFEVEVVSQIKVDSVLQKVQISADRDQLIRLFNNLIKNSLQAESSERQINIEIKVTEEEAKYKVEVKDNGIGIDEEQIERIFEPSFTTKSSGTGLGLAMSKNIMNNLGGKIEIVSTVDIGTTFILSFPKA
jgi:signal transduction histidine kinase